MQGGEDLGAECSTLLQGVRWFAGRSGSEDEGSPAREGSAVPACGRSVRRESGVGGRGGGKLVAFERCRRAVAGIRSVDGLS